MSFTWNWGHFYDWPGIDTAIGWLPLPDTLLLQELPTAVAHLPHNDLQAFNRLTLGVWKVLAVTLLAPDGSHVDPLDALTLLAGVGESHPELKPIPHLTAAELARDYLDHPDAPLHLLNLDAWREFIGRHQGDSLTCDEWEILHPSLDIRSSIQYADGSRPLGDDVAGEFGDFFAATEPLCQEYMRRAPERALATRLVASVDTVLSGWPGASLAPMIRALSPALGRGADLRSIGEKVRRWAVHPLVAPADRAALAACAAEMGVQPALGEVAPPQPAPWMASVADVLSGAVAHELMAAPSETVVPEDWLGDLVERTPAFLETPASGQEFLRFLDALATAGRGPRLLVISKMEALGASLRDAPLDPAGKAEIVARLAALARRLPDAEAVFTDQRAFVAVDQAAGAPAVISFARRVNGFDIPRLVANLSDHQRGMA